MAWHTLDGEQVAEQLASHSQSGLAATEASRRLLRYGPNDIERAKGTSLWRMLIGQFADFMILVLIVAAIISGILGELVDTAAILVILMLNASLGVFQEYRAQRAVAALRQLAAPTARVIRDGVIGDIPATDLVAGDLVLLEAGRRAIDASSGSEAVLDLSGVRRSDSAGTLVSKYQRRWPLLASCDASRPSAVCTATTVAPTAGRANTSLETRVRHSSEPSVASSAAIQASALPTTTRPAPIPGPPLIGSPVSTRHRPRPSSRAKAATPPFFWTSATACRERVVLPLDSGP